MKPHQENSEGIILKLEMYIISLWLLFLLILIVKLDIPTCIGTDCHFIGIKELFYRNALPALSLLFIALGCVFYLNFEYAAKASKNHPEIILEIEDLNYEHLTFLTTYIVPLICFNLDNSRYVISLLLLLFVIGMIYVKTDKFYANPTLAILGFRIYQIKTSSQSKIIMTKDRLEANHKVCLVRIDEKFYYGRKL